MKLNQQQAPLYGQCVITVQLNDDELAADEEGVDYFLLFAGTTQRHLSSTQRISHDTLQAVCPAHDCCEEVLVTLCSVSRDFSLPHVAPLAEHRFNFVQDLAFDMAQFLVSTAGRADALDGALLLDECQIPLQECERLDESLALALHHLVLPPGWSLLGNRLDSSTDLTPQETLLHFSARRGLFRVTHFLLKQPGAKEALTLANRQGHTPSTIAASCGHEHLYQLLNTDDPVGEAYTQNIHPVSSDARVVCHLPRLNTHSLTLRTHPGREVPTLQEGVEQLLHHIHAKGVSGLELRFDRLHTAAECCDAVETEITCVEELQQPAGACKCLDIITGDSCAQNCLVAGSNTDLGCGETESAENDSSLPVSVPKSEVRPKEVGLFFSLREQVCLSSEETDGTLEEQLLVFTQDLSVCHTSEGPQVEAERANLTLGVVPPTVCGKQAEETDREAVIWEVQEAIKGEGRSEQEEKLSTAGRREEEEEEEEEESNSESTELITPSVQQKAVVMGQSSSLEGLEQSENSDSEIKDCSQEGGRVKKDEMKLCEELCDGLSLHENEGLTDPVSASGDPSHPPMTDCGDVIERPEAAFSCLLIEGLLEGEPPPDTSSLEQNQETAGRDYLTDGSRSTF
ncbi:A-kinase anchor protein 13 [Cynoglossus semilaevis]|uniref:A-kinase anchor protein 13-like n=1 Tax=Cynoglossus semilaevis TaxID=244447 RepID=A0A3P8VQR1_CYNSE|nr:A-kinase anchor protein 13-like [Cynoglossus semilaevis]